MANFGLSDCTYECIKDTFYYGIFGDFKLVVDRSTGCFNATKLCDQGSKPFRQWKVLEKSKNLIEYYGIVTEGYQKSWRPNSDGSFLYEVKLQNNDKLNRQITGTYVPKEFILDIASWISSEFYYRCNSIIINYFVKEFKKMDNKSLKKKIKEVEELTKNMEKLSLEKNIVIVENNELKSIILRLEESNKRLEKSREQDREYMRSLGISLEEVKDQNEELLDKTKGLKKQNKSIQRKLGIAVEDQAPQPMSQNGKDLF
jgi:hypothetical protein